MAKFHPLIVTIACVAVIGGAALSIATSIAEIVRITQIDPLSGLIGALDQNQSRGWQYIVELATQKNWTGDGMKLEVVGFDNKLSPQGSLTVPKRVADQDTHYIVRDNGSSADMALGGAMVKYNERNPGKEITYLNYIVVGPDVMNSECNYWHLRLDVNSGMKMEILTSLLAKDPKVKKAYLINQNYLSDHQVARTAEEYLKRKCSGTEIMGEDLYPLAQVKDFLPYVSEIKPSGTDIVITGNWGSDLILPIKAGKDAGLNANLYTHYASTTGVSTAMGSAGAGHMKYAGYWNINNDGYKGANIVEGYKKKYNDDYYFMALYTGIAMLAKAIKQTKSAEPAEVTKAFEGIKIDSLDGTFEMYTSGHQGQQLLYIATWEKINGKNVKFDRKNTGYGWKTDTVLNQYVVSQPTSCQMKRPQ